MISAVFDTNVIISGVLFGGEPAELLRMAAIGQIDLVISDSILLELTGVLKRPKFKVSDKFIEQLRIELSQTARLVITHTKLDAVKFDPQDNRILECAVDGNVNYLVTGDTDLLRLKRFRKVQIVTVADFVRILAAREL